MLKTAWNKIKCPKNRNFLPPTSELVRASEPVLSVSCPVPLKRMAPKATAPTPKPKAPYQRNKEWVALKLTGKRAQKGKTAAGTVRYTYEVEWKGNYKPTYEPRENLIGTLLEQELAPIDEKCDALALLPQVNVFKAVCVCVEGGYSMGGEQ